MLTVYAAKLGLFIVHRFSSLESLTQLPASNNEIYLRLKNIIFDMATPLHNLATPSMVSIEKRSQFPECCCKPMLFYLLSLRALKYFCKKYGDQSFFNLKSL